MENERVIIIGGGIIGCATAYMLKKISPASQVLLLEASHDLGHGSSYQNGGTLSYTFNLGWNTKKMIPGALISGPTSFLSINSSLIFSPSFWFWAIRSIWASFFPGDRDDQIFNLGKRSSELHVTLRKDLISSQSPYPDYLGDDSGLLILYSDLPRFTAAENRGHYLNLNFSTAVSSYLIHETASKLEPTAPEWKTKIVGALKNNSDYLSAHDSFKLTKCLAGLAKQMGVGILLDSSVEKFNVKDGKITSVVVNGGQTLVADKYILCTGNSTREIGEKLGWAAPIWPAKGITMNLKTEKIFKHTLYLYDDCPVYVTPLIGGKYRVSSFVEFTFDHDYTIDETKIKYIEHKVRESFSINDAEFSDFWACKRPVSADDLPIIGHFPGIENLFINAGHGSKGSIFCLSSAEIVSHLVIGKSPLMDPRPFSPNRFWF